jgi:hypothetical protein
MVHGHRRCGGQRRTGLDAGVIGVVHTIGTEVRIATS